MAQNPYPPRDCALVHAAVNDHERRIAALETQQIPVALAEMRGDIRAVQREQERHGTQLERTEKKVDTLVRGDEREKGAHAWLDGLFGKAVAIAVLIGTTLTILQATGVFHR